MQQTERLSDEEFARLMRFARERYDKETLLAQERLRTGLDLIERLKSVFGVASDSLSLQRLKTVLHEMVQDEPFANYSRDAGSLVRVYVGAVVCEENLRSLALLREQAAKR